MHQDVSVQTVMLKHLVCAGDYRSIIFCLRSSVIFVVKSFESLNVKLEPGLALVFLDLQKLLLAN